MRSSRRFSIRRQGTCLRSGAALLVGAMLAFGASGATAQEAAPGISEEYQDWRLQCSEADGSDRSCILRQEQSRQNGERLLTVEISHGTDGSMRGTILLPFGILFDRGVTLRIDGDATMEPLPFRTCLPTGCIATFDISPSLLSQMRMGVNLNVAVMTINGQEMTFPVSLSGFTSATNRLSALVGL